MRRAAPCLLIARAAGHAMMYEPPIRQSRGVAVGGGPGCAGVACTLYSDNAGIGCPAGCTLDTCCSRSDLGEPTILDNDTRLRTWCVRNTRACMKKATVGGETRDHPWRKPGSAGVLDPCGVATGYPAGASTPLDGLGYAPPGMQVGDPGSKLPKLLEQTVWIAGSTAEVAWAVVANHGGGYQYRLCPAGEPVTEGCFQRMPLRFVGDTQWLQYDAYDPSNRTEIPATQVATGTVPTGSQWRKNPIPACMNGITGFSGNKCSGPQFEPPVPGFYGLGQGSCFGLAANPAAVAACVEQHADHGARISRAGVVDKVHVPDVPGDYVLSWRWDTEGTPQVWNACADVTIKAAGRASTPFAPTGGCEPCCAATRRSQTAPGLDCSNCTGCLKDRTGACAYCWEMRSTGVASGLLNGEYLLSCLGNEDPSGGPTKHWAPGTASKPWSPGCKRCWEDKGACTPRERA